MIWVLSLLDVDLSTRALTAGKHLAAFGVCLDLIGGEAPRIPISSSTSARLVTDAAPKCISGSTSYFPV